MTLTFGQRVQQPSPTFVRPVVLALVGAAMVEVTLLRFFTRVAIHIPAFPVLQTPEAVLSFAGKYAYFVTVSLVIVALPLLALSICAGAPTTRRIAAGTAAGAILTFSAIAVLMRAGFEEGSTLDLAMLAAAVLIAGATAATRRRLAIPVSLFAVAFVLNGVAGLSAGNKLFIGGPNFEGAMLNTSELLFVAFSVASLLLVERPVARPAMIAGAVLGGLVLLAFAGGGSATMSILLLWNEGLSGWLPGIFYAAAAACLGITIVSRARGGDGLIAAGLLLLLAGGSGLHSTYQTALVFAGLGVLAMEALRAADEVALAPGAVRP